MPRRQQQLIGGALVAALVLAAAAGVFLSRPAPVTRTGTLVIEAVPWATVIAIESADGAGQPLPSPASTPLSLTLPIGTYTVRLAGPPPSGETRQVTVQVQVDGVTAAPVERFPAITPEEYFEQYLTASAPAPDPESPAEAPAAAVEAPAAPAEAGAAPPARPPGPQP